MRMEVDRPLSSAEPTPKSFFFHSPPDSPQNDSPIDPPAPVATTADPTVPTTANQRHLSQLAHSLVSFGNSGSRRRPSTASSTTNTSRFKFRISRPSTSTSDGKAENQYTTSLASRPSEEHTWHYDPDPFAPSSKIKFASHTDLAITFDPRSIRRLGSKLSSNADHLFSRGKPKTHRSQRSIRPVSDDVDVLDISPAHPVRHLKKDIEDGSDHYYPPIKSQLSPIPPTPIDKEVNQLSPQSQQQQQQQQQQLQSDPTTSASRVDASLPPTPVETPVASYEINVSSDTNCKFSSSLRSSNSIPGLPSFPTTYAKLSPSITHCATFQRYQPSQSALTHLLARSRAWKARLVCLSSFPISTFHSICFLHVFKQPTKQTDNVEIDRLEVTEDSVVFIADEEVGGKTHVLRIGGTDVGSGPLSQTDGSGLEISTRPENGQRLTIWFFRIEQQGELHDWISAVRDIVVRRREHLIDNRSPLQTFNLKKPGLLPIHHDLPEISPVSPIAASFIYPREGDVANAVTQSEENLSARDRSNRNSVVSSIRGFFSSSALPTLETIDRSRPQSMQPAYNLLHIQLSEDQRSSKRTPHRFSTSILPANNSDLPTKTAITLSTCVETNSIASSPSTPVQSGTYCPLPVLTGDGDTETTTAADANSDSTADKPLSIETVNSSTPSTSIESGDAVHDRNSWQDTHRAEALDALTQPRSSSTHSSDQTNSPRPISQESKESSIIPPNRAFGGLRYSTRIQHFSHMPEMSKPPLRPLPRPPNTQRDEMKARARPPSSAQGRMLQTPGTKRLSSLLTRSFSPPPMHSSLPPLGPPPTGSLPAVPDGRPAVRSQTISDPEAFRRERILPPVAPVPMGPLPKTPTEEFERGYYAPVGRPRFSSAPPYPEQIEGSQGHPFRNASEPSGEDDSKRESFMEYFTPPGSAESSDVVPAEYEAHYPRDVKEEVNLSDDNLPGAPLIPRRSSKRPKTRQLNRLIVMNVPEE